MMFVDPSGLDSVVYYAPGMKDQAVERALHYMKKYSTICYIAEIDSAEKLVAHWRGLATWAQIIDTVEIISHGAAGNVKGVAGYGIGHLYFDDHGEDPEKIFHAKSFDGMDPQSRSASDLVTGVTIKELIINSCNSANPDIYNVLYGFILQTTAGSYEGWDGGTSWDPKIKDHVKGGGYYQGWKFWDPWENVRQYQHTWWTHVEKDSNGVPGRDRIGKRAFYI